MPNSDEIDTSVEAADVNVRSAVSNNSSRLFSTKKINVVLYDNNYLLWHQQVYLTIKTHRLLKFVDSKITPPSEYITKDNQVCINPEFELFEEQDGALATWLLSTVSESVLPHLIGLNTASKIWNTLHRLYSGKSTSRLMYFRRLLYTQNKGDMSMKEFLLKVKTIRDNLASCGEVISEHEHVTAILNGLPSEYETIITVLTDDSTSSSVNHVSSILLDADARHTNLVLHPPITAFAHSVVAQQPHQSTLEQSGSVALTSCPSALFGQTLTGNSQTGGGRFGSQNRDNNRGRGRSSRPQCQLCGRMGHLVERCYFRFDMSFKNESARSNQNTTANTFVSPQANVVFASSPVYYASTPHAVALPQGFNSSISPSSHSVVQYNRPMSSPLYTQLSTQYVAPLPQHPAMMQSSPTGAAQFHIATPEVLDDNAWFPDLGATHHITNDVHNLQSDSVVPASGQ